MKKEESIEPSYDSGRKSKTSTRRLWRDLTLLLVGTCILFGTAIGARDLWNPNEAIYGRAVVEMNERGDWLVPTVNGKVFAEKPILYYWGALAVSSAFGEINELSLRVPSFIAGVLSVLLIYLLVQPYSGNRQALIAAALLATQYEVFWSARSVQMDILVLVTTLGMLLPLSRMLDFGLSPRWVWPTVGLVAGVGLLAKGPVTCIVPAAVFLSYCASRRLNPKIMNTGFPLALLLSAVVAATWYGALYLQGQSEVLKEVLYRQNFSRFSNAWDHVQPWWYYLKYFWIEFAPGALLVPAAIALKTNGSKEFALRRLAWGWITIVIFFFSLSESKRAPYILPGAPAVAILSAAVIERLITGTLTALQRRTALGAFGLVSSLFSIGGIILWFSIPARYPDLVAEARILSLVFIVSGLILLLAIAFHDDHKSFAPGALLAGIIAFYLTASIFVLPSMNERKSARSFSETINSHLENPNATIASYNFWDWRAGYPYYTERMIPNYKDLESLTKHWRTMEKPYLIVESPNHEEIEQHLVDAELVHQQKIGSRTVYLFTRNDPPKLSLNVTY